MAAIRIVEPGVGLPRSARLMENSMPVVTAAAATGSAAAVPPVTPAALLSLIAKSSGCVRAVPDALGPNAPAGIEPAEISPAPAAPFPADPGTCALPPPARSMKSTPYEPVGLPQRE